MGKHVLRCFACKKTSTFSIVAEPTTVTCPSCGVGVINCGPLPKPDWSIPSSSAVEPEFKVHTPGPCSIDDVPKWVCPWCGGNAGPARQCRRCSCDLTRAPVVSLRDWVEGMSPSTAGAYRDQAMLPMNGAVALIRLYRLDPDAARGASATESLVQKMTLTPAPPGVDRAYAPTQPRSGSSKPNLEKMSGSKLSRMGCTSAIVIALASVLWAVLS